MGFSKQEYWSGVPLPSPGKLLELINEFGKVTRYRINTQKPAAFLYTKNKVTKREIKEIIPFIITSKRISRNKHT